METRIGECLPPKELTVYQRIPLDQRIAYESALDSILRQGDPKYANYLAQTGFRETDLDHVGTMLNLVTEIETQCPTIAKVANMSEVRYLTIIHEAGEICTGDFAIGVQNTPKGRKAKERERIHGQRCVIDQIDDPELKQTVANLYNRWYENKDVLKDHLIGVSPQRWLHPDVEVELTKYLDMVAGTVSVNAETVFQNWMLEGLSRPTYEMYKHVRSRQYLLDFHRVCLHSALAIVGGGREVVDELERFHYPKIKRLQEIGYNVKKGRIFFEIPDSVEPEKYSIYQPWYFEGGGDFGVHGDLEEMTDVSYGYDIWADRGVIVDREYFM